jgi:hypothetical protein
VAGGPPARARHVTARRCGAGFRGAARGALHAQLAQAVASCT